MISQILPKPQNKPKDSKEFFQTLFDYAPDPYYITDLEGKFIDGNKAAERITGYRKKELIGKSFFHLDILPAAEIPKAKQAIAKNQQGFTSGPEEFTLKRKDNKKITVEIFTYPIKMEGKLHVLAIARDITLRRQSEQRIKHLGQVIHAIRNVNKLIIREKDRDVLIQKACNLLVKTKGYYNAWIALLDKDKKYLTSAEAGYGPAFEPMRTQLENGNWPRCVREVLQRKEILITDNPKSVCDNCPLSHYLQHRSAYTISLRQNNTLYGVFSACIPESYAEDKEEQALFKEAAEDITFALYSIDTEKKRRQAEESLRKSDERFRVAFKNSPVVVWSQDKELRYNWIYNPNPGFSPEEVLGRKDEELLPFDDARVLTEIKQKVLETGKGSIAEVRTTIKGKPFFYQLVTEPLRDAQGNLIGITCASIDISEFREIQKKLEKALDKTIETMSKIVDTRDPYTSGHQSRVSQLATRIALELNLSPEKVKAIRVAALIHDIGKVGIPSEILTKPSKLTDIEFSLIKAHSQMGYDILKDIDFPYPVAPIILQHHERINGSGYPNGIKGDEILLEAKIVGVADVVEAMSSHRPYRAALGVDIALDEIVKNKGILYDSEIVDVCVKLFKEKGFRFE
ncbi:MAG: PAS domain S-box protein [Atribacterota bacterium]|nr:PAS domain S-box protein [Atribacterota bacterium]MDD5638145.1 PAS domain S-box protein [Atribacterota bacterium]